MKTVAIPAAVLITLIVAGLTWALWPTPLEQGLKAQTRGDYVTALAKLRPLAEAGNAQAQFAVGRMIAAGQGAPPDAAAAVAWFLKAAAQGHAGAALELGDRTARGDSVPASAREALQWYLRAAKAGDSTALARLTDLAQHGSAPAMYQLGLLYAAGEGAPLSRVEAARWFRAAAARGIPDAKERLVGLAGNHVPEAAYQLGQLHERGEGVPLDLAKAVTAYTQAGSEDHLLAQVRLGEMYAQGKGVPRNDAAAAQWFAKAAHQGHPEAQYRYGLMLLRGRGAAADPAQAARWIGEATRNGLAAAVPALRELAASGNASAQYRLATVFAEGKLVPQDYRAAFDWLRRAAQQGLPIAQNDLAYAYGVGQGTAVDAAAAAHWYGEATSQGFAAAVPKLADLAQRGVPAAQFYYGRYLVHGGVAPVRTADQTDDLVHAVARWIRARRSSPVSEGVSLLRKAAASGNAEAQAELDKVTRSGKE